MTKVSYLTGCIQNTDYTILRKQYPISNLPEDDVFELMEDVSIMATKRDLTTRGKDKTTLQSLCRDQKICPKKPENVCIGKRFASKGESLSKEDQKYCQLDVEAPLLLYALY